MKRVLLLFAALIITSSAVAQSPSSGIFASLGTSYGGAVGKKQQTYTMHSLDLEFGYQLTSRVSLHMPFSANINLFNFHDSYKDYRYNSEIGGGVGIVLVKFSESKIESKAQFGVSLADNWRYRYYDGSVIWDFDGPFFGIGYRFQDTYRGSFSNYSDFYATIGYKIFRNIYRR